MTIPFLDLFRKLTGRSAAVTAGPPVPATLVRVAKKPAGERLSKTVLPHATRSFSPPDPFRAATAASLGRTSSAPLQLGSQHVTAPPKRAQSAHLPPALARALEPKLERAISLRIADFIDRVPTGYIKPIEILDASARVSLKASEIEKGMPEKNPTISLSSLYQQVPEIFLRGVRPDDETRVALPYEKVLEQFKSAHVRTDQMRDPAVPQVETPILKATIQDSERFGTKIEPIETSPLPSVPVKPATAESIAEAEPDATVQQTTKSTSSAHPVISLYSSAPKPESEPPGRSRPGPKIPFVKVLPNGTGASASERVPASSGPPVPTPLPFTPELAKIAFAPSTEAKTSPKEKAAAPERPTTKPISLTTGGNKETQIALALQPIIEDLPGFQWHGELGSVESHEVVLFSLSAIEPQLASGRVCIPAETFAAALPEKHRASFEIDEAKTPVALPLEDVLKNLPVAVLKLRDDQEDLAPDRDFETPFSIKAKEDAQRFSIENAPAGKTSDKPAEQPAVDRKIDKEPVAEKKVDPKEFVAQASALEGVKACAITFSDGLSLAGELPAEIAADGLCAIAPGILERVAQHIHATKLGPLVAVTLYTGGAAVSFFGQGNVCLTALHAEGSLSPQTRTQIAELVERLSRTYTQPETPHVDH